MGTRQNHLFGDFNIRDLRKITIIISDIPYRCFQCHKEIGDKQLTPKSISRSLQFFLQAFLLLVHVCFAVIDGRFSVDFYREVVEKLGRALVPLLECLTPVPRKAETHGGERTSSLTTVGFSLAWNQCEKAHLPQKFD